MALSILNSKRHLKGRVKSSAKHLPLLIVAQSARFLAQAAQYADRRVWAADCFGDTDTLDATERWQALPPLEELTSEKLFQILVQLSNGETCQLIYGGGLEYFSDVFSRLPNHIQLMGNTAQTLHQIAQPDAFFTLLSDLELPFPDTCWHRPKSTDGWLYKPQRSLGGLHILPAKQAKESGYFQREIKGMPASVLFIANGTMAHIIGVNRQWLNPASEMPFRLGGIETPFPLNDALSRKLIHAIQAITQATKLVGLNSVDFILAEQGGIYLLEINPRPSASAELYHPELALISLHLAGCQQHVLPDIPGLTSARAIHYHYAAHTRVIPADIVWPVNCHDLPAAGETILAQQPVYTEITSVLRDASLAKPAQRRGRKKNYKPPSEKS